VVKLLPSNLRAEWWRAIWLALIAGYVDAYALIAYGFYVSIMSGNTTQVGSMIGQGKLLAAVPAALAIVFFLVGSFAGTWLIRSSLRHSRNILFGVVAAVLAVIIGGTELGNQMLPAHLSVSMLGLAMGLMNVTTLHIGVELISVAAVTGSLNGVGVHLASALRRAPLPDAQGAWDTHLRRAGFVASVWGSFLIGATMYALASLYFGVWALLAPFLGLLALTLFSDADRNVSTASSQPGSSHSV
jgi:uncharacterized membrane protein YoaK (UPF0700 family)